MNQGPMNERIGSVFTALMVSFAALIGLLTWWQVLNAGNLKARNDNSQRLYYEQLVERGKIWAAGGRVLAQSEARRGEDGRERYVRRYPAGPLAAHVVGYYTVERSKTGLEQTWNDFLSASNSQLASIVRRAQGDEVVVGDSLRLTIDGAAQQVAQRALGAAGSPGAIVAIDPRTGRILVMASSPTFDPNLVEESFGQISSQSGAPLLNRAVNGPYQPGSTFKLVTAVAALEDPDLDVSPDTTFPGGSSFDSASGPPIENFGGASVGSHDLTQALTQSINVTFAALGEQVGDAALREQMERFGFGEPVLVEDLPHDEQMASGLYREGSDEPLPDDAGVDVARVAIGQERLQVTPLQMAMVAGAIANGGEVMRPYLVHQRIDPDGEVAETVEPEAMGRAMSQQTATQMTEMMTNVVREGTGTAAALEGIDIAGKTGTADTASGNQVWFVAFAPANDPEVAIAVTLEGRPEGDTGGVVAAPIAREVLVQLLGAGAGG